MEQIIKQLQPFALSISFVVLYVTEYFYPQRKELSDRRHDLINIGIGILNLVWIMIAGYYFQRFILWYSTEGTGLLNMLDLPSTLNLVLGIILIDIFMYWWHRANHELPFLWKLHSFHHVDTKMNTTTGLRFHAGELALSYLLRLIIFPLLGISLNALLIHGLILFPVVIFHHSNIRISSAVDSKIRWILVSPLMHRIHHSVIKAETNSNYSSVLPYWDRLFRTYKKVPEKEITFGI